MKIDGGCHCNEIAFEVEIDTKQAFCNNFGSQIYSSWQGIAEPQSYRLRDQLTPGARICHSSVKSWSSEIGDVRIVETN